MAIATGALWVRVVTLVAALTVFAVVQDRVTADGARRYVALQRDRAAAGAAPVRMDEVMRPAIERSVRQGALCGGVVLVVGLACSAAFGRSSVRR